MNKQDILKSAAEAREQEVLGYQINIDNYSLAIAEIDASGDPDLAQFREQLVSLLSSEKVEQKKALVMLTVLKKQIEMIKDDGND